MTAIVNDLSVILAPVSTDSPCGENLYEDNGYEIQFAKLVQAGLGIAAESFVEVQQLPTTGANARTAWIELEEELVDLFRQTKHLDMLYLLSLAEGNLRGLDGLIDAIDYTNSLIVRYWDDIHPSESEADYEFRQDCLKKLDSASFSECLHSLIISDGRQLGKFTFGAWLVARRDETSELKAIEQAIMETLKDQPSYYDEMATKIKTLQDSLDRIDLTTKDLFLNFRLPFKHLRSKLNDLICLIGGFSSVAVCGVESETGGSGNDPSKPTGSNFSDQINSREDVIKSLAKIILYYTKNEPTSPVPALLERAQRVATMNFREIVEEFKLTGTPSIQDVLGWKDDENSF